MDAEFLYLIQWGTNLVPYFMLIFREGSRTKFQKRATAAAVNEYVYSLLFTSLQHLGCIGGDIVDGRGWRKYFQMYLVATPATIEASTNARNV